LDKIDQLRRLLVLFTIIVPKITGVEQVMPDLRASARFAYEPRSSTPPLPSPQPPPPSPRDDCNV